MSGALPAREIWKLIDDVRDRSYDIFVYDEKKRMHDLVGNFKTKGVVAPDDVDWLKRTAESLKAMGISPYRSSRRRLPRAKRGRANVD
ncbi:MAG TPA: hypothetical protein VIE66_06130 [Methylocella sp.]|jgi:hypothetical protein